jgi:hypothetical protein
MLNTTNWSKSQHKILCILGYTKKTNQIDRMEEIYPIKNDKWNKLKFQNIIVHEKLET